MTGEARGPRIFFVCSGDPWAGAPHQMMAGLWLQHRGYSVQSIIEHGSGDKLFRTPIGSLPVLGTASGPTRRRVISRQWSLLRLLLRYRHRFESRRQNSTLYYIVGSTMTPAALIALKGIPARQVIYHTQDFLEPGRHPIWEFFERRFARRAGLVVCNDCNRARFLSSYYRLSRLPLTVRTGLPQGWPTPNNIASARAALCRRLQAARPEEAKFLMAGGPYSDVRHSGNMIQALQYLPGTYRLVFPASTPGSVSCCRVTAVAQSLGVLQRIVLLDHMPYEELLNYTAACDAGFLLYVNDGIGNYYQCPGRLSEYMLGGLPMVMSDFPVFEALALKYDIGVICNGNSPEAIAAAARVLIEQSPSAARERRRRIVQCGKTDLAYDRDAVVLERHIENL